MFTNEIILAISRRDTLRPLDIQFRPSANSVCDTKYHKRCSGQRYTQYMRIEYGFGVGTCQEGDVQYLRPTIIFWLQGKYTNVSNSSYNFFSLKFLYKLYNYNSKNAKIIINCISNSTKIIIKNDQLKRNVCCVSVAFSGPVP